MTIETPEIIYAAKALRTARDAVDAALLALGQQTALVKEGSFLTDDLGPNAEWRPSWLTALNAAMEADHPTGFVGDPGPDFDGDPVTTSRAALILFDSILYFRVLERQDLTAEQRAYVQHWCNNQAQGMATLSIYRDHITGIVGILPCWTGDTPTAPGRYAVALSGGGFYPTEAAVYAAVRDFYARAYGLPKGA